MTPDQIHEAHRRLKQLDKLHETKTHVNRSRLAGVWVEFSDETRKLLPISEIALREFIDQQITKIEDSLRGQGVAV